MTLSVSFVWTPSSQHADTLSLEIERDAGYEYLVIEACNILDETDCSFHIGGFGRSDWGLDVGYDMSAFVEQLPDLLAGVRERRFVEVDLYPPGVERTLEFHPDGNAVNVRCLSRTHWIPDPVVETIGLAELEQMLVDVACNFAKALTASGSAIARIAPFDDWQKSIV